MPEYGGTLYCSGMKDALLSGLTGMQEVGIVMDASEVFTERRNFDPGESPREKLKWTF